MGRAIYNSAIPNATQSALTHMGMLRALFRRAPELLLFLSIVLFSLVDAAADWNLPAQQLARKIAAFTGPGTVAFTVENRSSLRTKDVERITADLRSQLELLGVHSAELERAAGSVSVFLSENAQGYVWVAEMQVGSQSGVVMVSTPRSEGSAFLHEEAGLTIHKIPLWEQEDRILDVVVLEEDSAPKHIAVLDAEKVALYRRQNTKWQQEQVLAITHVRPWPRDLRGRLVAAKDHLLDIYLPGVFCRSTTAMPLGLTCRESDDPWPLVVTSPTSFPSFGGVPSGKGSPAGPSAVVPQLGAFYAPTRNFFTAALAPGVATGATPHRFNLARPLRGGNNVLWLFAGVDGQIHLVDGVREQAARLGWGSDVASVRTSCGSGWQVLATGAANGGVDSVRAYELPDRDPVPVSDPQEVSGEITALWTEAKGDSAIAVARNRETGHYEAFRLVVACSQ